MVQFQINVVNVSAPVFVKTAKGGYSQLEIAFKRDGKLDGKKLVDFNGKDSPFNVKVYTFCKGLKEGDVVNVTAEKGEKFWAWTDAEMATGGSAEAPAKNDAGNVEGAVGVPVAGSGVSPRDSQAKTTRGRVVGNTYETPAERALRREADRVRQYYIVRQSSISAAIEFMNADGIFGGGLLDTSKVIEVARQFEGYVFEVVPAAEAVKPAGKFDDMEDDIPF